MDFKASLDTKSYVITAGVILLFFSISNITSWFSVGKVANEWAVMGLPIFCIIVLAVAYGFSTKSYTITGDEIIIRRPFKDAVYQRSLIAQFEHIDRPNFGFAWRLFGSGGLFGYYGIFSSSSQGRFTLYGTQTRNYVVLNLHTGNKIVLTPDEPAEMIAELQKA